jgi:hypothetical protein
VAGFTSGAQVHEYSLMRAQVFFLLLALILSKSVSAQTSALSGSLGIGGGLHGTYTSLAFEYALEMDRIKIEPQLDFLLSTGGVDDGPDFSSMQKVCTTLFYKLLKKKVGVNIGAGIYAYKGFIEGSSDVSGAYTRSDYGFGFQVIPELQLNTRNNTYLYVRPLVVSTDKFSEAIVSIRFGFGVKW